MGTKYIYQTHTYEQGVTQGHFSQQSFTGLNLEFSFSILNSNSTVCPTI